jgi:5'-methylthioadenosine phosphorylase
MKIGVISGQKMPIFMKKPERIRIETPFGDVPVRRSVFQDHELFFINRHGGNANIPPHKINNLGNIQAFSSCHVECIISIGTVGSLKKSIQPGDFVIPHDFVDFTKSRRQTFFDDKRVHIDVTNPYCVSLRELLIKSCENIKQVSVHKKGVYLATEGPRLETVSEIKFFSTLADIVGMTAYPEMVLSLEKGMCYSSLCIVCNMAAGLQERLPVDEIVSVYTEKEPLVSNVLALTLSSIDEKRECTCKQAFTKAIV